MHCGLLFYLHKQFQQFGSVDSLNSSLLLFYPLTGWWEINCNVTQRLRRPLFLYDSEKIVLDFEGFEEDEKLLAFLVRLVQQHRDLLFRPWSDAVVIVYVLSFLTLYFPSLPLSPACLSPSACHATASPILLIV